MAEKKKTNKKRTAVKKKVAKKTAVTKTARKAATKQAAKKTTKQTAARKKPATKVTKAVAKKTTAPSTSRKRPAQTVKRQAARPAPAKVLVCAADEQCFWVTDGQVLRDLRELEAALAEMVNDVFRYHVSKGRHDFADWVEHVLCDADCAAALRRTRTPRTARVVIRKHLRHYNI